MPIGREHVRKCIELGIKREICKEVNKWIDEPVKQKPGCNHRKHRHDLEACIEIAQEYKSLEERLEAFLACVQHIYEDCKHSSKVSAPPDIQCELMDKLFFIALQCYIDGDEEYCKLVHKLIEEKCTC
ncbi:MAG: hypothetical protein DRJ40_10810 [Thermoprotei archaeon]|nr:MAG: hypothetical protein DRJ40_10810 [Thermoprotei archaeon]